MSSRRRAAGLLATASFALAVAAALPNPDSTGTASASLAAGDPAAVSVPADADGPGAESVLHAVAPDPLPVDAVPASASSPATSGSVDQHHDHDHADDAEQVEARETAPPPTRLAEVPADADVVEGTLVRAYSEPAAEVMPAGQLPELLGQPVLITWIETGDTSVQVTAGDVDHLQDGAQVRAVVAAAADDTVERQVLAVELLSAPQEDDVDEPTAAAMSPGVHQVTVVMVRPGGVSTDGTSLATVVAAVEKDADAYWSGQTAGAVRFDVVKAVDWRTTTATCSNPGGIWSEAATASGWSSGTRRHLMVYVSRHAPGCSAGLGTVGSTVTGGGRAYVQGTTPALFVHELGHNLGLGHSDGLMCDNATEATSGCRIYGYRDWYDAMGISWSQLGSLNPLHAHALGALSSSDFVDVTSSTQVMLRPTGGRTGVRAVRLQDGDTTYWLEYRTAVGQDAWLSDYVNRQNLDDGVLLRRTGGPRQSLLLDASPSFSSSWSSDWQSSLPAGSSVRVGPTGWSVSVDRTSSTGAVVTLHRPGTTDPADQPVQIFTPGQGEAVRGGQVEVAGTGTGPEGTLRYEIVQRSTGSVVRHGRVEAGANGTMAPFSFTALLPVGDYTVSVWAPDYSDDESGNGPRLFEVQRSFTMS